MSINQTDTIKDYLNFMLATWPNRLRPRSWSRRSARVKGEKVVPN
jgi:hypothetical protein